MNLRSIQRAWAESMAEGVSPDAIAQRYQGHISRDLIARYRRPSDTRTEWRPDGWRDKDLLRLLELREQGLSWRNIGKALGRNKTSVQIRHGEIMRDLELSEHHAGQSSGR